MVEHMPHDPQVRGSIPTGHWAFSVRNVIEQVMLLLPSFLFPIIYHCYHAIINDYVSHTEKIIQKEAGNVNHGNSTTFINLFSLTMAKKKGFMTPERKKKLRTLLRKKAVEELKKEQERKVELRIKTIAERCGSKADIENLPEEELKKVPENRIILTT